VSKPKTQRNQDLALQERARRPKKYCVVLIDDDYTPFDFVISLLMTLFFHPFSTALELTEKVHETGRAVAGQGYSFEIAQAKAMQVIQTSQTQGHPFQAIVEPQE
jgi:ATP-dependent Clp protease adaptor protein ClpS